jgi:hypothetical protein
VLVAALACLPLPAWGENAPTERSLASQIGRSTHKVVNEIHKGSIVAGAPRGDPLGLIGAYQLDYALWVLLDEPVEDYLFRWELGTELWLSRAEKTTLERVRQEDPDLFKRLEALAPVSVTLRARVRFHAPEAATMGLPFAEADLDITPDLTAPSGKPQPFSVPGSPEWGAWMKNVKHGNNFAVVDGKAQAICGLMDASDSASCLKKIWKSAKRVELTNVAVIGVEWPEVETRMLLAAISDRRRRAEQKASDRTASDEDFWSKPAPPAPPPAAQRSDIRTKTVAETNRPLDKKAREARQKRYVEKDQELFSVWVKTVGNSCWLAGDLVIGADKSLGDAEPTVTWNGTRLKGEAKDRGSSFQHYFHFEVTAGTHALDITLAGPRPISRHERVRCYHKDRIENCPTCRTQFTCGCEMMK